MSVEMKLGRWEARDLSVHKVLGHFPGRFYPWLGEADWEAWSDTGRYGAATSPNDLIRYLGPLELSPTTACADQAGTPVASTVSTETAGEQLRRVNARLNSIRSELGICRDAVRALERTESDLEELAKRLEREVEESPSGNHEATACAVIQDSRRGES